jgi:hypothetical protein
MSVKNASREPRATRPAPIQGYAIPQEEDGMVPWRDVNVRLAAARNYWLVTAAPDGQPHSRPVWAVWVDGVLYFDGAPHTGWGRKLTANPRIEVHLESGDDVVILKGVVEDIPQLDRELYARVAGAFTAKYDWKLEDHGCFALRPRVAYAWTSFPADATRFHFD